ncbi:hypothetical protein DPX16_15062 [Anabarilius grahami]|uniref:Uncharacterized protein n=1 Tax=Anabarilius grahami TaxID=495550 RepID=A0A3N0YYR2_ANAGA|nr:hypothetical protein DPX16_15062 [Anabarilius grahami]
MHEMLRKTRVQQSNKHVSMEKRRSGMQKRVLYENELDTHDCRVLCETSYGKWTKSVLVPAGHPFCCSLVCRCGGSLQTTSEVGLHKSVRLCLIPQFVLLRSCSGLFASSLLGAETAPLPSCHNGAVTEATR